MAEFLIRLRATSTGIVDLAGNTWSALGSMPEVSNTKSKFDSGYSIYISSPGKALQKGADNNFLFTPVDAWTFSAWICPFTATGQSAYAALMNGGRAIGYQRISIRYSGYSNRQPAYIPSSGTVSDGSVVVDESTLCDGNWHHVAVTQDGSGYIRTFFDGVKVQEYNETQNVDWGATIGTGILGEVGSNENNAWCLGYFDDICLVSGEALWVDDFTPPTRYLALTFFAYLSNNNLYTGSSLTNLTNNWSGLTNAEKEALVPSFSDEIPSIQDLATISPFRVLTDDTSSSNVKVTGQPKPQIIVPTSLINTGTVSTVQSINITNTITDTTVKFAITTDLTTYKVYDATQGDWVTSTDVEQDGMSIAQINALTPQILALLDVSNGIAFKQCFIATSENASAELSEISAVVDIDGSWSQSVHGTDYSVTYPNKTTMSVRLLTNGDYIINYPIASGGGAVTQPLDYIVRFRATNVGVKDLVSSNQISTIGSVQPIVDSDFYNGVALKCANNSYVKIDLSSSYAVNGMEEFTISAFVKCSSVSTWEPLFGKGGAAYGPGIWISYDGAFRPWFRAVDDVSVTINPSISCSMNVVHHIALVKAGSTMSLYVDGILSNSTTYTSIIDFGSYITIGAISSYYSTAEINDLCIIRNKALWTTNFVPPTEYLPDRW